MKTIYLECNMGAAGDMLMAALLELHNAPGEFLKKINEAGIPGVTVSYKKSVKCGITGTQMEVMINGREEEAEYHHHEHEHPHHHEHPHNHKHHHEHEHHSHNDFSQIVHLISHLNISDSVKKNVLAVYKIIAEAESHAHGVPVNQIHFHEVGEMDALADITGVCMLIEELAPDAILSSPVNVGSGQVRCAHGILPVPAPAVAHILRGIPMYGDDEVKGELCTPTGAALLKHFTHKFCKMPVMETSAVGYGMGKKEFAKANCVRAFLGETETAREEVVELVCNLDDMTPESVAFSLQLLLDEGALDVYTTPIGMKKSRMGISFTCMCRETDKEKMLSLIFKHTSTLGIREYISRRHTLKKEETEIETEHGRVRVKTSRGYGVVKTKPEYEDVARIAREKGLSIKEVLEDVALMWK